ncbi:AsmA-like C-terminal domain-containing protein [Candidatus Paracaedibacter symbiosus]|uniref:YhdP family protein n=1 Tax=Candidatus Paracaedibacter symbiosus TaxID=244582 RepID=UPI000509F5CC|nr:AsmA-like C-terminal domain-containing protein [Candidatus Paracaedibacter symbiosus]
MLQRYLKFSFFAFSLIIVTAIAGLKVVQSPWGQQKILDAVIQIIAVNTPFKDSKISYSQITWGGFRHPLSLSLKNFEVKFCIPTSHTDNFKDFLGENGGRFHWNSPSPSRKWGKFSIKKGQHEWGESRCTESNDAHEATLSIERLYLSWSWGGFLHKHFNPSKLIIENSNFQYQKKTIATANLTIQLHTDEKNFILHHLSLNPKNLANFTLCPDNLKEALATIHLPLKITGKLDLKKNQLSCFELNMASDGGDFTLLPYFPTIISPKDLSLSLFKNTEPNTLNLAFKTTVGMSELNTQAQLIFPESLTDLWVEGGKIEIKLLGNVTEIPFDNLATLWPVGLAPKPRHWVTTNLSHGAVKGTIKSDFVVALAPKGQISDVIIQDISGDLYPVDVTVNYLGNLPPVRGTSGHCYYTKQQLIIENIVGTVNGLHLSQGHIIIDDLHKNDQHIQIVTDLLGDVSQAFEIISAKPLLLLQKLGLSLNQPQGLMATRVLLKFPLESGLTIDQVQVEAQSHLSNAKVILEDVIAGQSINLSKGGLEIAVDNDHLYLSGEAELNAMPATLEWTENFNNVKAPFARKLSLAVKKDFKAKNEDFSPIIGEVPIELIYTKDQQNKIALSLTTSLKSARLSLPWFSYHKNEQEPASLYLEAKSTDTADELMFSHGRLTGKDLNAEIFGTWGAALSKLTLSKVRIGEMQGNFSAIRHNDRLKLEGSINEFDVFTLFNELPLVDDKPETPSQLDADIRLTIGNLIFSDSYAVKKAAFTLQLTNGNLQTINIKDKADEFNFTLTPEENGIQHFNLESTNAAELLELLTPGNDLSGGKINFVGQRRKVEGYSHLKGEIDIKGLTVHEAPTLAKILSLSSLEGIMRTLSGDGLKFDHGHAHLSWKKGEILLDNAYVIGTALGLTFTGMIVGESIHFTGEVIPFYALNNILSRIPLMGQILSGNSEHAIFSTPFALSGNRSNPNIHVQPLTTLAPGGMRRMLEIGVEKGQPHQSQAPGNEGRENFIIAS